MQQSPTRKKKKFSKRIEGPLQYKSFQSLPVLFPLRHEYLPLQLLLALPQLEARLGWTPVCLRPFAPFATMG